MKTISFLRVPCIPARLVTVFTVVTALLAIWTGVAFAEIKSNIYVNGIGTYGNGYTLGYTCQGVYCVNALTWSTTYSMYYIEVNTRHWHLASFSNPEYEYQEENFNSTSSGGIPLMSYAMGDPTTSRHRFKYQAGSNETWAYTSYPDNSASSYWWWACGKSSC